MRSFLRHFISGLTLLTFLFISFLSYGAYLRFVPQEVTQPDGSKISCYASGDEFYNWLHDKEGFTIIQSKVDGYYYYAELVGEELAPSNIRAGAMDPAKAGLTPWINIPAETMEQIRSDFLDRYMPSKPPLEGFRTPGESSEFSLLNNLVVYIRFSDQGEFARDTMYFYDMFNNTSAGYNSMQNYFWDVTYETLEMPSWFYPIPGGPTVISYQDIFPRNYYLPYDANTNPNGYKEGQRGAREHALLKRACQYIENEVPASLDIDNNGDGYVDNMIFNVRGAPSAWSTLLWPHRWALYNENVFINGKRVWDYNFQIETELDSRGNGVLCHETYHTLGAPDLYHYGSSNITSVGRWDVMDQNMNPPQSMGAYMKYRYGGWIEDIPEITECGVYELNPVTSPDNNCFKIASPNSNLEFFVLEFRLKQGTFEGSVPGSGLLVYRIDKRYDGEGNAGGPPDEVYVYRPGGTPTGNGSLGEANFSADEGRTEINDETDPSSFLQNGQPGGLNISNVGYVGETISFEVTFDKEPVAGFTSSETVLTEGCSIDFYDNSFCDIDSWEWSFEGGTPATSTEQNPEGVAFNSTGTFDVTLKATNQFGSNTVTLKDFVTVSDEALPIVKFKASDSIVCTGSTLTLIDESSICPESWSWEITPETGFEYTDETTSTSQHPSLAFTASGSFTVKSTVTNANGSSSMTKESYLTVGGFEAPFEEDFESNAIRSDSWTIVNSDDFIGWDDFSVSGNGGFGAAGMDNFEYFKFLAKDQLISPPIDLSKLEGASLYFDHAYALTGDEVEYSDTLNVLISSDCGENWTRLLSLVEDGNGSFATREPTTARFVPGNADDWCGSGWGSDCHGVDISQWAGNDNVQIMFESVRILGNNLYIDNVRVGALLSTTEPGSEDIDLLKVTPNPSYGLFNLSLGQEINSGQVMIYNSNGQQVLNKTVMNGQKTISIDLRNSPGGLYFVRFEGSGRSISKKVIIR